MNKLWTVLSVSLLIFITHNALAETPRFVFFEAKVFELPADTDVGKLYLMTPSKDGKLVANPNITAKVGTTASMKLGEQNVEIEVFSNAEGTGFDMDFIEPIPKKRGPILSKVGAYSTGYIKLPNKVLYFEGQATPIK